MRMRLLGFVVVSVVALGVVAGGAACSTFSEEESGADTGAEGSVDAPGSAEGESPSEAGVGDASVAFILATGLGDDLTGIDTNGTDAFVIKHDGGPLFAVDVEDGGARALAVQDLLSPSAILAFTDRIVWSDFGHHSLSVFLFTAPGAPTTAVLPPRFDAGADAGQEGPSAIAHIPGSSELALATVESASGSGSVATWKSDSLGTDKLFYENATRVNIFDVAATPTKLYWTESSSASVYSVGIDGTGAEVAMVANQQGDCESIAAEGADVYWARPQAGLVSRAKGAGAQTFVTMEKGPFSLAVDTASVYWLTTEGALRRASRADASVVTLASGFKTAFVDRRVQAIALTSTYVVWITSDGQVLRLPK